MKISITIPVTIDNPMDSRERKEFKKFIEDTAEKAILGLRDNLAPAPRMYKTVCRFSFEKAQIEVD